MAGLIGTGEQRLAGPIGTGEQQHERFIKSIKKLTKASQDPPGISRTHLGSTRDALGALGTTFDSVRKKVKHHHQGHAPDPRALIELQGPSDRITHAGTNQISRFGLTPQPPI